MFENDLYVVHLFNHLFTGSCQSHRSRPTVGLFRVSLLSTPLPDRRLPVPLSRNGSLKSLNYYKSYSYTVSRERGMFGDFQKLAVSFRCRVVHAKGTMFRFRPRGLHPDLPAILVQLMTDDANAINSVK